MLKLIDSHNNKDVIFGRDADSWNHEGNRNFRLVIAKYQAQYHAVKLRFDKVTLVAKIVGELKDSGVRFLRRDSRTGKWFEVDHKAYIEKVGHAIRDRQVIRKRKIKKQKAIEKKKIARNSITPPKEDEQEQPRRVSLDVVTEEDEQEQPTRLSHDIVNTFKKQTISQPQTNKPTEIHNGNIAENSLSQINTNNELLAYKDILSTKTGLSQQDPRVSTTIKDILEEDLILASIKKRQAITKELITLHQQTAVLASLRARDQLPVPTKSPLMFFPQEHLQAPSVSSFLQQHLGFNSRHLAPWAKEAFL